MSDPPLRTDSPSTPLLSDGARRKLKKAVAILFLGFLLLIFARFAYSFALPTDELSRFHETWTAQVRDFESLSYKRSAMSNLAQLGIPVDQILAQGNVSRVQVFEKTGQLSSSTSAFDEDQKKLFD